MNDNLKIECFSMYSVFHLTFEEGTDLDILREQIRKAGGTTVTILDDLEYNMITVHFPVRYGLEQIENRLCAVASVAYKRTINKT